tara:strand:+ start:6659 stop:6796 length:138 start_codon:yes stop_codon:yes gene_type:complete
MDGGKQDYFFQNLDVILSAPVISYDAHQKGTAPCPIPGLGIDLDD